jgi:hypothetical protein
MDALGFSFMFLAVLLLFFTVDRLESAEQAEMIFLNAYFISFMISWGLSIIRLRKVPSALTILFFVGLGLVLKF